jgi:hypothetical protein
VTDTAGYTPTIDALHRNHWPVRWDETGEVIGELIEHITVTLDLPRSPVTNWSWRLTDEELARFDDKAREIAAKVAAMKFYVTTFDDALAMLTVMHRVFVRNHTRAEASR